MKISDSVGRGFDIPRHMFPIPFDEFFINEPQLILFGNIALIPSSGYPKIKIASWQPPIALFKINWLLIVRVEDTLFKFILIFKRKMIDYKALLSAINGHVRNYMVENIPGSYCFHDDGHTDAVVTAVKKLAQHYNLDEVQNFIVTAAAYFHDVGYINGGPLGHEERSAELAEEFLIQKQVPEEIIIKVRQCILATKIPQKPNNLLEEILCDADLFHLGMETFDKRNKLMRQEVEAVSGLPLSKNGWRANTLLFMRNHHYHTEYAKQLLNKGKEENIERMETEEAKSQEKVKKKAEKENKPERGIETMFRITSTNNQRLSDMADNKANILITVNSIILSMIIALLLRKLDNNEYLTIPTLILLLVSLCTMVSAILSTRPKISSGYFTAEDVASKRVNLLFFGNFHAMGLEEYNAGMQKAMKDKEFLYSMLTKDVYSQGVVLGRKYRLLRVAYNIFMYGIIVSVLAFLIAVLTLGNGGI